MRNDRLKEALASWPQWSASEPSVVEELNGGLTNRSYLIRAGNTSLVLRLNAKNTEQLGLDRALETQVLQRASSAAIAPALVYSDPTVDVLITEFHDGPRWQATHSSDPDKVRQLAQLLKTAHRLAPVYGALDLQQRADHYWLSIDQTGKANNSFAQSISTLQQPLAELFTRAKNQCVQHTLCHNDLLADNLLFGNSGELIALDWEYAAMGDPYFELAVVVEGHQMNAATVRTLLQQYTDTPTNAALQRLGRLRVIYCYLDLLWYVVQSSAPAQTMLENKLERLQSLISIRNTR